MFVESVSQNLSFVFGKFLTDKDSSVDKWLHFGQIEISFYYKLVF